MPRVSIIVPNYNHARFLARRLASIQAQTYRDFEVILLDDCSTDSSRDILRKWSTDHGWRFIPNTTNSGSPFRQWNKGADLAEGDLLWFAESDDAASPDFLARALEMFELNPEMVLCYCQSFLIDEYDTIQYSCFHWTQDLDPMRWRHNFVNDGAAECREFLLARCTIPNASAVLMRKDAYRHVGGAPENFTFCGDWMMYARVLGQGKLGYLAEPLNYYRWHSGTVRASKGFLPKMEEQISVASYIDNRYSGMTKAREKFANDRLQEWAKAYLDGVPISFASHRKILRELKRFDPRMSRRAMRRFAGAMTLDKLIKLVRG